MHSIKALFAILFVGGLLAVGAPVPDTTNQVSNAYSGAGGHAIGGSVTHKTISGTRLLGSAGLLKIFSDNAGNGGRANSGPSLASIPPNLRVGTKDIDGTASNSVGNAFSGVGGVSDGGAVNGAGDALIEVFSGNGGNAGSANSGLTGGLTSKKAGGMSRVSRLVHLKLN